ncbi:MAG: FtsX-like permease family protein [Acidimicrobiales bacterium]
MDVERGLVQPTVMDGRAPVGNDEVLLASHTLAILDKAIGDEVELSVMAGIPNSSTQGVTVPEPASARFRIVGLGVLPEISGVGDAVLGQGAMVTFSGLTAIAPQAPPANVLFVNVTDDRAGQRMAQRLLSEGGSPPIKPAEVDNFGRVSYLPVVIALVVILLAGGIVVHALVAAVRRRRRDLALLRAFGFVRRQVGAVVAWHATATMLAGLLIGVPLGSVVGLQLWIRFADDLGVPPQPVIPLLATVLVAVVALIVGNGTAAIPGRRAAKGSPASALRAE